MGRIAQVRHLNTLTRQLKKFERLKKYGGVCSNHNKHTQHLPTQQQKYSQQQC